MYIVLWNKMFKKFITFIFDIFSKIFLSLLSPPWLTKRYKVKFLMKQYNKISLEQNLQKAKTKKLINSSIKWIKWHEAVKAGPKFIFDFIANTHYETIIRVLLTHGSKNCPTFFHMQIFALIKKNLLKSLCYILILFSVTLLQ